MKEEEYIALSNKAKLDAAMSIIEDTYFEPTKDDWSDRRVIILKLERLRDNEAAKFQLDNEVKP